MFNPLGLGCESDEVWWAGGALGQSSGGRVRNLQINSKGAARWTITAEQGLT